MVTTQKGYRVGLPPFIIRTFVLVAFGSTGVVLWYFLGQTSQTSQTSQFCEGKGVTVSVPSSYSGLMGGANSVRYCPGAICDCHSSTVTELAALGCISEFTNSSELGNTTPAKVESNWYSDGLCRVGYEPALLGAPSQACIGPAVNYSFFDHPVTTNTIPPYDLALHLDYTNDQLIWSMEYYCENCANGTCPLVRRHDKLYFASEGPFDYVWGTGPNQSTYYGDIIFFSFSANMVNVTWDGLYSVGVNTYRVGEDQTVERDRLVQVFFHPIGDCEPISDDSVAAFCAMSVDEVLELDWHQEGIPCVSRNFILEWDADPDTAMQDRRFYCS